MRHQAKPFQQTAHVCIIELGAVPRGQLKGMPGLPDQRITKEL